MRMMRIFKDFKGMELLGCWRKLAFGMMCSCSKLVSLVFCFVGYSCSCM